MTAIQKHVASEITKVFLLAIGVLTMVMTLGVGVNEGVRRGLPLSLTLQVMPYAIPETLRMTIPAALLFSVCTVFGRMSASGEITAIKSMGVHPSRLFKPALLLAFVLSICTFGMYDVCAAWARPGMKETLITSIDEMAYSTLKSERMLNAEGVSLAVRSVEGRKLIEPRLRIDNGSGELTYVEASFATLQEVEASGLLRVNCENVFFDQDRYLGKIPGDFHYDIPFKPPLNKTPYAYAPAELRLSMLDEQIDYEQRKLSLFHAISFSSPRRHASLRQRIDHSTLRLNRLRAESQRRWSNGFAVFAFALVGIPIATWSKSQDNMTVFFMCIVPIALVYYPLMVVGEQLARRGVFPSLSVWLGPAILIGIGLVLLNKLNRH